MLEPFDFHLGQLYDRGVSTVVVRTYALHTPRLIVTHREISMDMGVIE